MKNDLRPSENADSSSGELLLNPMDKGNFFSGVADFEKYLDIVRNNKLLIAGVLAVAVALGLIVSLLTTPQYRSTARIEISLADQNVTNVEGLQNERVMSDRAYLPTQYELLESHSLAMRVVRELDLVNDEEFIAAFEIEPRSNMDMETAVVNALRGNIEISPITNSLLVDISFASPSRELSARIANAWAEGFIAENLDRRFGATLEARDFLEERLGQTRDRLEDAERQLIAYATEQGLDTIVTGRPEGGDSAGTASQTLVASELAEFNTALQQATANRFAAESALAARTDRTAASDNDFGNGTIATLRAQRASLLVELAELQSRFNASYPPVQALQAQVDEIEAIIASEQSASSERLRANYREALAQEERLRGRVADLRDQFRSQRRDSVEYNILQREVDTNRELYSGLLQRYREIGVVGVGESNVLIVDEARPARNQFKPRPVFNILVAAILGLIVVALGVYLYEFSNQSLRDPRQVKERLGLPLLASIPRAAEEEIVLELSQSYSEIYESYFSLTSSLAYAAGGSVPTSLMVTSSRPGEGKSFSAVALAYLLSRQGKKVILLDCDLRKSGIGKYLDQNQSVGVSQYLQGNDDWRSMIVQPSPLEGFDAILAGRKSPSTAELLANGRLQGLLDLLEEEYDHVIVDAPPVLGLVDAPLMASSLGGVILIVEANEGKWRYIESAVERLRQSNAAIIGVTVTKLDERNAMYGYGEGYGYGYGAGTGDGTKEATPA